MMSPDTTTQPPTEQQPAPARERLGLREVFNTSGKILLGLGLLALLMSLTVLRNGPAAAPHSGATVADKQGAVIGAGAPSTAPPTTLSAFAQSRAEGGYLAVQAAVDPIRVYDKVPPGSTLFRTFPQKGELDVVATFLVLQEAADPEGAVWYQVRLPMRPNGTTGWLRAAETTPVLLHTDLRIDLSDHRLDVYDRGQKVRSYPVGVGRGNTPTPPGDYYITTKMKPIDEDSVYGALAMGISGYSEKLVDWPGGGQVGIHGTNDPSSIGKDVSAGCIRLRNEDILELTHFAPLGTPVFVQE